MASTTNPAAASSHSALAPPPLAHLSSDQRESAATTAAETGSHTSTIVDDDLALTRQETVEEEFEREALGPKPGEKGWDKYEVTIGPDDPEHPQNWSRAYRWYLTMLGGLLVLNA